MPVLTKIGKREPLGSSLRDQRPRAVGIGSGELRALTRVRQGGDGTAARQRAAGAVEREIDDLLAIERELDRLANACVAHLGGLADGVEIKDVEVRRGLRQYATFGVPFSCFGVSGSSDVTTSARPLRSAAIRAF